MGSRQAGPRSVKLGVTGGIGSGKSTVAGMLRQNGAALIDADAIARSVTEAEGAAIAALRDEFGPDYITDGALESFLGIVEEIDTERQKVRVVVSMFGRETPVELDLDQIESI